MSFPFVGEALPSPEIRLQIVRLTKVPSSNLRKCRSFIEPLEGGQCETMENHWGQYELLLAALLGTATAPAVFNDLWKRFLERKRTELTATYLKLKLEFLCNH